MKPPREKRIEAALEIAMRALRAMAVKDSPIRWRAEYYRKTAFSVHEFIRTQLEDTWPKRKRSPKK